MGFLLYVFTAFLSMYFVEFDSHMMYLTDWEEWHHYYFRINRYQVNLNTVYNYINQTMINTIFSIQILEYFLANNIPCVSHEWCICHGHAAYKRS